MTEVKKLAMSNLKIEVCDDEELAFAIRQAIKNNNGYCPCRIERTPDTKCMCKEFREQETEGSCHCGLYVKVDPEKIKE